MMKNTLFISSIFITIILNLCCNQTDKVIHNSLTTNNFWGDKSLSFSNYFSSLNDKNSYQLLKQQNLIYEKEYLNFTKPLTTTLRNNLDVNLIKNQTVNQDEIKINLYTYNRNKKIDSIQFYRKINNDDYGRYYSLSYLNIQQNKIWQIKYFQSSKSKLTQVISYSTSIILKDGHIKTDSLFYMDESLEAEIDRLKLYY
ncbi:MAG: hypothetical protein LBE92_10770 [Chryseobacterium sp.]|jgi:hypothetical protein|uniref:hypothetical protein n=1 Tax=Chryseobacterium sp. TaxID=1871047 RepID=UPI00282E1C8A|nr:hypothetical protein [Chryseobacterium sp.]MDR2236598.1 hypothetical protein [Chryseobacterium sp.]